MKCIYKLSNGKKCNVRLTMAVERFSYAKYQKPLCYDHQKVVDLLNNEYLADLQADIDLENQNEFKQEGGEI